ncbi:carbohydrate kinase [Leptolyngbya sp. 'hensonii']|uniref:carbohydrate kinase family protein n=1 Tax=Leptolyngbya sp. 'hensonii' TaxID=1922337 RepID=UPI00094FD5D0|nr:carbohydrate kinase [Leptolyngbya sp. 'hensonii']OLP19296.1 carbohydrate kinase [Leptolyngbya sp. 'hensonii']
MTPPRVLCLGEILFDFLANQPGLPPDQVRSWTPYAGGAPANVAFALTKLGTSAGFIGCVGQDQSGEELIRLLDEAGVDRSGIQRYPAPTRKVSVVLSETGDRTFAGFRGGYQASDFADAYLQADLLPTSLFETADFLVLGTLELAYPDSRAAIERAISLAEQHYVKILVDINWRPMFWPDLAVAIPLIQILLKQVDFLKLSVEEAEWLFGTSDPGAIGHRLGNVEGVLVTAGAAGCAYCLSNHEGRLSAFEVDVEDTTGAGDGFVAGFVHQLCTRGWPALQEADQVRDVVIYASAVGALTALRPGAIAAQPTGAEVDAFLYLNHLNS